jgi:hypothetical protein
LKTTKIFLLSLLLIVFAFSFAVPDKVQAQDTTYYSTTSHDVGRSIKVNFTQDSISTSTTVSDWFDVTGAKTMDVYVSTKLTNTDYGYSAGNDSLKYIIQGQDANDNIMDIDTSGVLVSSGLLTQTKTTPSGQFPKWRFKFIHFVTGTHKNGYTDVECSAYTYPK